MSKEMFECTNILTVQKFQNRDGNISTTGLRDYKKLGKVRKFNFANRI